MKRTNRVYPQGYVKASSEQSGLYQVSRLFIDDPENPELDYTLIEATPDKVKALSLAKSEAQKETEPDVGYQVAEISGYKGEYYIENIIYQSWN